MKKTILVFLTILSFSATSIAQKLNIDSLEKVLNKAENKEKELEILKTLSNELYANEPEKAIKFAKKGLSISEKEKNKENIAEFLMYLGKAYSYANDFKEANKFLKQSVVISLSDENFKNAGDAYYEIAYNHFYDKQFDSTNLYCSKMLDCANKSKDAEQQAKSYYLRALVKRKKNQNKEAYTDLLTALKFYQKTEADKGHARTLNITGQTCLDLGKNEEAIEHFNKSVSLYHKIGDVNSVALVNYNIGKYYLTQGKFDEAMTSFQSALKSFEKSGNNEGIANCYNNIGIIYEKLIRNNDFRQNQPYYKNALNYHQMAYEMRVKTGNELEQAKSIMNSANIYLRLAIDSLITIYGDNWEDSLDKKVIIKNLNQALSFYQKALKTTIKFNDKTSTAQILTNIGNIFHRGGKYHEALENILKATKINEEIGNQDELLMCYIQISRLYIVLRNSTKATESLILANKYAEKLGNKYLLAEVYLTYSNLFEQAGDYKNSFLNFKKYKKLQDEIVSDNNFKTIQEMSTKYDTEKKENEIKLQNTQIKQQRFTIYGGVFVMLLIIGIVVLLIKQNKERQRVNQELEKKNHVITEQKQEITDSIKYASLIQTAAMPSFQVAKNYFSDLFVFFRPRDIVSGDFHWIMEYNGKMIVAAVDCTGHGVPGAFMSMLGISTLNNVVSMLGEVHADTILNNLRLLIINSLHQTGKSGESKDGMDIALYIFDPTKMEVEYSGANNSLVLVRNGEMIETKANKMPIGIHDRIDENFTLHTIKVEKGDMIYTFSDGYADQFGGEENKKFMSGKMKKMFASIAHETCDTQMQLIEKANLDWRGNNFQVDDMIVIGARI